MKKFEGIYTALVTPFRADGKIDAAALQQLIDMNLKQGVNGFYVSGSTGESYLLSAEERCYLMDAVMEAAGGRCPVIVNVGMFATQHSISLAEYAGKKEWMRYHRSPHSIFPFPKKNSRPIITSWRHLRACRSSYTTFRLCQA